MTLRCLKELLLTGSKIKYLWCEVCSSISVTVERKTHIKNQHVQTSAYLLLQWFSLMNPQPVQTSCSKATISACPRLRVRHWMLHAPCWMAVSSLQSLIWVQMHLMCWGSCIRCYWEPCPVAHHCQCSAVPHSGEFLDTFHVNCCTNCCLTLLCSQLAMLSLVPAEKVLDNS